MIIHVIGGGGPFTVTKSGEDILREIASLSTPYYAYLIEQRRQVRRQLRKARRRKLRARHADRP